MQKTIRINENQLFHLAQKARQDGRSTLSGFLYKKSSDTGKWQQRYFVLYENLLFYYDGEKSDRPSGVALLEGCYCEKMVNVKSNDKNNQNQGYCFAIYYKKEGQRQYDLRTDTEVECNNWVETIKQASFSKTQELKEELEQKHLHLLQILESERQAKWHYVQQTEELAAEVKKLKSELRELKESRLERKNSSQTLNESEELRKIKKVQSFFRGWLCRRRWKQIVEEYIRSEHAESMRKRNNIVFGLVECEEEYVQQLSIMVSCFLRPFKMAASSKKPIITHEDVNSTFLNAETLLFLHQIFLQGLRSKIENWPTLQLGDLFDMLLPMLGIYQEYVRNHHYSLQVLAEYKQKPEFNQLLKRYEEKPACEGRSLESFLTYPMHQIPRYIITLHELLAHTPHDHVDREKLEYAKSKLEELSNIMHDEVSETENIRKNLAIERMIVEGCDILLDVNQIFVRQGSLIQVINEKSKSPRARLGSFGGSSKERKEIVRQVFLFTNHLLITTRASNGRLHLAKNYGKINLVDCTLIEDTQMELFPVEQDNTNGEIGAGTSNQHLTIENAQKIERIIDYNGVDFRILIETKNSSPVSITLVASSIQEKAAWCSDISQCIEQLHYSDLLNSSLAETSSVSMPQSIRSDPKLYRDDVDIQFSRRLNSCKVPQIRHASLERLMDRLTDLRFLSIDFLNTFLLTYRVFTNGITLVNALRRILNNPECGNLEARPSFSSFNSLESEGVFSNNVVVSQRPETNNLLIKPQLEKTRRISTGMMKMEVTGTESDVTDEHTTHSTNKESSIQEAYETNLISFAEAPDSSVNSKSASSRRTGSLDYPNMSSRHAKFPIMKEEEFNQTQSVQISVPNLSNLSQGIHENLYNSTVKEESEPSDSLTVNTENSGTIKIESEQIEVTLSAEENIQIDNFKDNMESKFSDKLHDYIKFDSMSLPPGFGSCHTPSSSKMKLNLLAPPSSPNFTHADLSLDSYSNWSSSSLSMNINKLAPIASCEILSEDRSFSSDDDDLTFRSILKSSEKETGFEELSVIEQRQKMYQSQKSSSSSPDKIDKPSHLESSSIVGKLSEHFKQISCPSYINSPPLPKAQLQLSEVQESKPSLYSAISLPSSPNKQLNKPGVNPIKYKVEPIVIPEANLLDHKCIGASSTPSQSKNPMTPNRIISPANSPKLPVKGLSITPKRSALTISSRTSSMPTPTQSNLIAVSPSSNNQFPGSSNLTITTSRSNTSFGDANKSRGPSISESSPSPTFQELLPSSTLHPLASAALNLSPSTTVTYHHRQSSPKLIEAPNRTRSSVVSWSGTVNTRKHKRPSAISCPDHDLMISPRPSVQLMTTGDTSPPIKARAGAVVTSSRCSKRRSSNTAAAQAFAAATAGCINPGICNKASNRYYSTTNPSGDIKALSLHNKRLSVIYTAATMRVLNVVRHWISKFPEDFDSDPELKNEMKCLLEDLVCNQNLIPNEHKVAGQLLRQLMDDQLVLKKIDLDVILTPIHQPSRDSFDTLSALDIAEQLTYLDHQIFRSIRSSELLNQTWMKADKAEKAPHVLLVSTRFNELSRLVVSEIVCRTDINDRVACIEKWAAIADICRCIHNYNGVLQICAAFVNSSVYRLKRTWEKVPKQSRVTIEKLQNLVSSDGRFKNMREALHRCDPPCIPYLGMYLTDLSFIEEGALNLSENKLINFCKMRMIAHTIREIQQYQQTPYRIERHPRVTDYLLDRTRLLEEEKTYQASLRIEPRQSISRQGQPILQ